MTPFPLTSLSGDHRTLGLAVGVGIGTACGFVLERAGLGRARTLVGQFYGRDMTVLRVLFTAVVTAMLGALLLARVGLLDVGAIELRYPTYLWPMIVGGLVLGVGFVVSGYCPGTCVVGAASGKLDALATLAGVALGGLAYAELEGAMGRFPASGDLGPETLSRWLGVPAPFVAAAVGSASASSWQPYSAVVSTASGSMPRRANSSRS